MKRRANLLSVGLACLWLGANAFPLNTANNKEEQRTALPLLLLLSYPGGIQQVGGGSILPGIPIRRPNDEPTVTRKPTQVAADEPQRAQSDESEAANALIREQFIKGVLQGLQTTAANGGATIPPTVLADILAQAAAAQSTKAPSITAPPPVKKQIQSTEDNNEADYDYIDFKNGSRIKYELESDQQSSNEQYPNKILHQPIETSNYYNPVLYAN